MTVSVSKSIWNIVNGDAKNSQEPTKVSKKKERKKKAKILYTIASLYMLEAD